MSYLKSAPSNLSNFAKKQNFWNQKCLILGIFGSKFIKISVIFEISNQYPEICLISKFLEKKKKKSLNSGPKIPYLNIFRPEFFKNYYHISNMHPQIWQIVKLCRKTKTPNFVTKNAWVDIFDQECLIWVFLGKNFLINYCHIWKQHL